MSPIRRLMGAVVLAGLLAGGVASAATPAATTAGAPTSTTTVSRERLCTALAQYIAYLQSLPPGPVRDALLRYALALQARYCGAG